MKWTIQHSEEALKFAEREKLFDEIRQEIKKEEKFINKIL